MLQEAKSTTGRPIEPILFLCTLWITKTAALADQYTYENMNHLLINHTVFSIPWNFDITLLCQNILLSGWARQLNFFL